MIPYILICLVLATWQTVVHKPHEDFDTHVSLGWLMSFMFYTFGYVIVLGIAGLIAAVGLLVVAVFCIWHFLTHMYYCLDDIWESIFEREKKNG